ncbi:translesion error-prone DNA polymerase V autoproteolytic subunit [Citrobacter portucalensis]|uniref:translesion error-prone DNA polymerase V autoproteolytic subunit n=1 Tax=Citrobacter portucalensis TaxID=1639133 RepID=UPI003140449F
MSPLSIAIPDPEHTPRFQPMFCELVPCGFPSPAAGLEDPPLDLHDYCVRRPASTYFIRCKGDSLSGAGITSGDLLVVDCSLKPTHGAIVVARVDGEFTVKRLRLYPTPALEPMNPAYSLIEVEPELLEIFGVVTFGVRDYSHVPA